MKDSVKMHSELFRPILSAGLAEISVLLSPFRMLFRRFLTSFHLGGND